jgi:ABC-2 type transport system permease protein
LSRWSSQLRSISCFGAAIGTRIQEIDGINYGSFIVPGLIMLSLLTQSIANASFGIYFPRFVGTIFELLSAPVSYLEIVIAYVGAAATKSIVLGLVILATAAFFVPLQILHPFWMLAFLVLTAVTFSLFGFIIGIWADGFEKLQLIPLLIITRSPSWVAVSIPSTCCRPSGRRSACSIPSSISSVAFGGAFSAIPMSASATACLPLQVFLPPASPSSRGYSEPATA